MTDSPWLDKLIGARTLQDDGTSLPHRSKINFVGSGVTATDDAGTNSTIVTVGSSSAYTAIQGDGAAKTARSTVNFVGFLVEDDAANSRTNVRVVREISLEVTGPFWAATVPGTISARIPIRANEQLLEVVVDRRTAGASGTTTVDVEKNGSTVLSSPIEIDAADGDEHTVVVSSFADATLTSGDFLDVVLSTVEAYEAGPPEGPADLRVLIRLAGRQA